MFFCKGSVFLGINKRIVVSLWIEFEIAMVELNLPEYNFKVKKTEGGSWTIHDRLRDRWVALTPEEWVRQHFVEWLLFAGKKAPSCLFSVTSPRASQPHGWWQGPPGTSGLSPAVFGRLGASGSARCQPQRRGPVTELPHFCVSPLCPITFGLLCNGVGPDPGAGKYVPSHCSRGHCAESQAGILNLGGPEEGRNTERCG